ncbi:MAG: hypothetical protein A2Y88_02305 [Chloroflexi bacterium RBG_13_48_10]|nr:MAG: hypothetical protein A2Y88_02305 [Chloroflexi bacterium RBG_13_48_10]
MEDWLTPIGSLEKLSRLINAVLGFRIRLYLDIEFKILDLTCFLKTHCPWICGVVSDQSLQIDTRGVLQ